MDTRINVVIDKKVVSLRFVYACLSAEKILGEKTKAFEECQGV